MLRVCAGTAITLLTLSVQLVVLEARHTSLVPRDGFVKNCVRFLGEHYDDSSKMICEDNHTGYWCYKDQCTSGDLPGSHAAAPFSTMTWSGCKRISLGDILGAEGVTASHAISVHFLPGQKVAVHGSQNGLSGIFDFECHWNSPSDHNARTPCESIGNHFE
ncbi:uncharacterized protein PGTG_14993 [Puccinia graminis f. sp. tritici CRL 75-36-700-3]|uniref:Uncharacterized protein n=1 Tax=Puccinia graminis f. sp. tritici (strain CRL 75-36-700-3 / race SCCL) TaxID=418459 RepID=E3KY72_PUCGT|nr:uncharacterized protein PGTG_14993 [Puccinia graminis f. sp. tritici CRL 75-36-700-3]EFP89152.2 hypothetical protein PGTG_14993 [Puccinia graminis f. sp. tritici CRL 75-36-700-3]